MWVPAKWVAAGMTGLPGTDVEVVELDTGSPLPASALPGMFITPHVAASTPLSQHRVVRLAREQAEAYLRGDPLRNVISGTY